LVEFYQPGESWVHRADPRLKLAFVVTSMLLLLLLQHSLMFVAAVLGLAGLYRSADLPVSKIWRVGRAVLPVSLLLAALRAIFYPAGPVLVALGPVQVTGGGLAQGATLGLRLVGVALAIFLWLYTTESQSIVRGLVKLGLPYPWGLSIGLALRFIPTIRENYDTIVQAQRARGLDLEHTRGLGRVQALLPGLIALMVSSLRASENVARALEARAFGAPGVRRSYLVDLAFRPVDWLLLLLLGLGAGAILLLYFRFGFGADPLRLLS
jgi:energy-coupling factor transport system permease protein